MVLASQQKNVLKGAELVQDRVLMVMVSVVLVNYYYTLVEVRCSEL